MEARPRYKTKEKKNLLYRFFQICLHTAVYRVVGYPYENRSRSFLVQLATGTPVISHKMD